MDDKNQIPSQNQTNAQAQPQAQPLPSQPQAPAQQPQGVAVGSLVKEHGPVATGDLRPSGIEPEIHPELKQIGVEPISEFPKVGPEEQRAGISHAKESVPVQTVPSGLAQIPMTEDEARQTAKNEKPGNALKWFAALIVKHFKMIHHKLLTSKG